MESMIGSPEDEFYVESEIVETPAKPKKKKAAKVTKKKVKAEKQEPLTPVEVEMVDTEREENIQKMANIQSRIIGLNDEALFKYVKRHKLGCQ